MERTSEVIRRYPGFDGQELMDFWKKDLEDNKIYLSDEEYNYERRCLYGGSCSSCGKPYRKIYMASEKHKLLKNDFFFWEPDCKCELTRRDLEELEKRIQIRLKCAEVGLNYRNFSFSNWDTDVHQDLNAAMCETKDHFYKGMFKQGIGLILTGKSGTGKTRCAVSILRLAAQYTDSLFFMRMSDYVDRIIDNDFGKRLIEYLKKVRMLVFDDFDKIATGSTWTRVKVYDVIDYRSSNGLSVIITTNLEEMKNFDDKFGEAVTSRLFGICLPVYFGPNGKDYRKKEILEVQTKGKESPEKKDDGHVQKSLDI